MRKTPAKAKADDVIAKPWPVSGMGTSANEPITPHNPK